ncbi:hypothetical protein L1787_16750 [Acuticoccus sp. M5D2P5]|uniref:hypothetical protein n=1 Tax=Acuticoccus kalidii TaxID=2910977 RepID=UPI001F44D47F|nr:hypothetical protein [Acuticoccus kalidii]MCF3935055.1 hypothetical protein [Acuticoccus kalidii]
MRFHVIAAVFAAAVCATPALGAESCSVSEAEIRGRIAMQFFKEMASLEAEIARLNAENESLRESLAEAQTAAESATERSPLDNLRGFASGFAQSAGSGAALRDVLVFSDESITRNNFIDMSTVNFAVENMSDDEFSVVEVSCSLFAGGRAAGVAIGELLAMGPRSKLTGSALVLDGPTENVDEIECRATADYGPLFESMR